MPEEACRQMAVYPLISRLSYVLLVLEELFLTTLTRFPSTRERTQALAAIHDAPSRKEGFSDLLWALLNSREFLFSQ